MRKLKVPSKQILSLYATFYQAYMSFFRFEPNYPGLYISFFQEKKDEIESLHNFIQQCQNNNIPILFHNIPSTTFLQRLFTRLFKNSSLSDTNLSTAAYFCQEILEIMANPSIESMQQSKFFPNFTRFSKNVLFPHLTRRDIHNAKIIDFYNHTFYWTSFSLKEILGAKRRLKSLYVNPDNI